MKNYLVITEDGFFKTSEISKYLQSLADDFELDIIDITDPEKPDMYMRDGDKWSELEKWDDVDNPVDSIDNHLDDPSLGLFDDMLKTDTTP